MRERTAEEVLQALRSRGARRLKRVAFRNNRSTIWSLTQDATVLNLHVGFRGATSRILDALATIVRGRGWSTSRVKAAAAVVRDWPGLAAALDDARLSHAERQKGIEDESRGGDGVTHCCATREQRRYLRTLYRYINITRFDGKLPDDIPVRLSNRMRVSLGHMTPGTDRDGSRFVVEIALNVDLMLAGNGAERFDTLIHEMAHVADWLFDGNLGHGATWKAWARRSGCRPETLYDRPVRHRRHRKQKITRVPQLPPALARLAPAARGPAYPSDGAEDPTRAMAASTTRSAVIPKRS